MAENKKSFVLYSDIIHTVKHLTDEQKGKLFYHILKYVNDENPTSDDVVINLAFEPIKQQLKRDLIKFEKKRKQYSDAGKKSAEARKTKALTTKSTNVNERSIRSTFSTVNVNVNDKNICEYYTHEKFIEWFNSCRKYIGLKSNIKKLSNYELSYFNELKNLYTIEDFKKSFAAFSQDEYYKSNNLIFPKNFLKPETFTKYLNTEVKDVKKEINQSASHDLSW